MIVLDRRAWWDVAVVAALGIAFGVAHTQAPLFFSNQHPIYLISIDSDLYIDTFEYPRIIP